jgi:hypothetical protein
MPCKELVKLKEGSLVLEFEGDEKYVLGIVSFLKENGWLKEEQRGKYVITDKCIRYGGTD